MTLRMLLLADAGGIVTLLIMLGSLAVWIYNQVKKAQEENKPQAPNTEAQERMRRDAQGQRPADQPTAQRPKAAAQPALRTPPQRQAPARLAQQASGDGEDPWAQPTDVATHVREHLSTQEFDQRTSSLGQISELDDTVEQHVQEAFSGHVGTISDRGVATEADAPSEAVVVAAAAGLAEMLSDPGSLRQAIILQEILRPPRWE